MSITIRIARASDVDDVARLTGQLGYDVAAADVAGRLSRILSRSDQQFFVADAGGRAAGWVHVTVAEFVDVDTFVLVAGLVVDRGFRRQGIGRLLMAEAESWARARGCAVVRLWSSAARAEAHRFYESLGYVNLKTQYSFAKSLATAGGSDLTTFVPRVE